MRQFALAVVVGLLTFSASGAIGLIAGEPCTAQELAAGDDRACPPTCVMCGCCAQAVEPLALAVAVWPDRAITEVSTTLPRLPKIQPRDILHVPKPALA